MTFQRGENNSFPCGCIFAALKSNSLAKIVLHVLTWKQLGTDCLMETTFHVGAIFAGNTCTSVLWDNSCSGNIWQVLCTQTVVYDITIFTRRSADEATPTHKQRVLVIEEDHSATKQAL